MVALSGFNSRTPHVNRGSPVQNLPASGAPNPNAILSRIKPSGASRETAGQDGLKAGVDASRKMARTDLKQLEPHADKFAAAGKKYGLPPALLAAIASRESRGGKLLDSQGLGDRGKGFGLMQVDKGSHTPRGTPFSAEHIDQAASILKEHLKEVSADHPHWSPEQKLKGAVAAYNFGADDVKTLEGMDEGTTGNDYSGDVWARALELAPSFGGAADGSRNTGGGPTSGAEALAPARSGTPSPAAPLLLREGGRGPAVKQLQGQLEKLGFELGARDGAFGPKTEAAVKRFQSQWGLAPDGIVGPKTRAALEKLQTANTVQTKRQADVFEGAQKKPGRAGGSTASGDIKPGRGWGGSEGVADAAKRIARGMDVPVSSEKRDAAATARVGSSKRSDHFTGNKNAFATDFAVSGKRGDQLAQAIAKKYGIPEQNIGTYERHTITLDGQKYSLQLLWKVEGHFDHVHLGIHRE